MKTISKVLMLGAVALTILGAVFAVSPASAGAAPLGSQAVQQQATPTVTPVSTGQQQTSSLVKEWDRFCVKKVPYTLLALPQNATFEIVPFEGTVPTAEPGSSSPSEFSCSAVGTFRGQQVVVCKGPQLTSFTLRVSSDGSSEDFPVGLTWCPIKDPSTYRNGE